MLNIKISPKKVFIIAISISALFFLANISCYLLKYIVHHPRIHNFTLINLDEEANIPTYFSSFLLLVSGFLLGIIAKGERTKNGRFFRHWVFLSVMFFYMSLDEAAAIHELLNGPLGEMLNVGGVFYFASVIPGIIVMISLLVIYLRFWLNLPPTTRILFMFSAVLYVGGVIGLEMVGGRHFSISGRDNLTYGLLTTVEESMELAGITLFIYALLGYLRSHSPTVHVEFQ